MELKQITCGLLDDQSARLKPVHHGDRQVRGKPKKKGHDTEENEGKTSQMHIVRQFKFGSE